MTEAPIASRELLTDFIHGRIGPDDAWGRLHSLTPAEREAVERVIEELVRLVVREPPGRRASRDPVSPDQPFTLNGHRPAATTGLGLAPSRACHWVI